MPRHTTQRSRASWEGLLAAANESTSLLVRRRSWHFPPPAIRVSTSTIPRSGGRSVWARIRSIACRWRPALMTLSPIKPARHSAYAVSLSPYTPGLPPVRHQRQATPDSQCKLAAPGICSCARPERMEAEFSFTS